MGPHLEKFHRRIKAFGFFLFGAAQFISALITIFATSLGLTIVAWLLRLQLLLIPTLSFSGGVFTTLLIVIITYTRSSPSRRLLRGYRWVKAEYLYTIHDDDPKHHSQTVTILLEAIRPGVNQFENRYLWSGRGQEDEPTVLSPGHSLLGKAVQHGVWKYYFVYLGRELGVGERVEVKLLQELFDLEDKFEPFLAKTVYEPLDRLVLRVVFPRNNIPAKAACREEIGPVPTNTLIKKFDVEINQSGEASWNIESPTFGHRYEIRWRK